MVSGRFFLGFRLGGGGLEREGETCSVEDMGDGLGGKGLDIAATSDFGSGGTGGDSWLRRPIDTWLS